MKTITYTKEVTQNKLEIYFDRYAESPRKWDNLGYFISVDNRHQSPDNHPDFMEIIKETGDTATDVENHCKLIKSEIKKRLGEKVLAVYPVNTFEHGNIIYRLGTKKGFDYSNNSFYIVTEKTAQVLGTPKSRFEKVIEQELKEYTSWANGEVYGFKLYGDSGEVVDCCGGYYDLEDIKSELGDEWKNENLLNYLK